MSGIRKPILTNICGIGSLYLDTMYHGFDGFIVYICEDELKRRYFCTLVYSDPPVFLIKCVSSVKLTAFTQGYSSVLQTLTGSNKIIKVTSDDSVNWNRSEVMPLSELGGLRNIFNVRIPHVYF